jgi:hypothetical protein
MHLRQQGILGFPQHIDPLLELQAVFSIPVVVLADELRRYGYFLGMDYNLVP